MIFLNFFLFFSSISNLCFPALNDLAVPVLGISCQNQISQISMKMLKRLSAKQIKFGPSSPAFCHLHTVRLNMYCVYWILTHCPNVRKGWTRTVDTSCNTCTIYVFHNCMCTHMISIHICVHILV